MITINNVDVRCISVLLQGTVYESTNPPTLEMECEVDEMDAEQTWPTEQDFAEAEDAKKLAKRVPKGNAKCLLGGDVITSKTAARPLT